MIILTIKTDQPESEFALYDGSKQLSKVKYLAHQDLGKTIHNKIAVLLNQRQLDWPNIEGIACFKGPGSFTGLRIGLSVANSLAYGLDIPVVGTKGANWINEGISKLLEGQNEQTVFPFYGAEPHVTKPKK